MGTQSFENCIEAIMHQWRMQPPLKEQQVRVKSMYFTCADGNPSPPIRASSANMMSRLFVQNLLAPDGRGVSIPTWPVTLTVEQRARVRKAYGPKLVAETRADPMSHPVIHGLLFADTVSVGQ